MGLKFVVDSACDLPAEYLRENGLELIPMVYSIGDMDYVDSPFGGEGTLTRREFYDAMREGGQPSTSQINEEAYREAFERVMAAGDDVFHIGFSGGLTGSLNNARRVAEELEKKYPGRRVYIVDSLGATGGEGLLVKMGVEALREGKTGEELKAYLEEERHHIHHWFSVENLVYLKRGGRISAAAAVVGTMLDVKPLLSIDDEGKLVPREKAKGQKRAIRAVASHLREKTADCPADRLVLVHSDAAEGDIRLLKELAREIAGMEPEMEVNMTPVIGSHTGPGLLALVFHVPGSAR